MARRGKSFECAMSKAAVNSEERCKMNKLSSLFYRRLCLRFVLYPAALVLCGMLAFTPANADSLWNDHASRSLVGDKRAVAVGDILNIVVQENNSASKDNKTKTSKQTAVDASISSFLYSPAASSLLTKKGQLPALKFDAKNSFDGGGSINNSEKILARISVQVVDVLPNRNLVVEGKR